MMRAFGLAMILLGAAGLGLSSIDWQSIDLFQAGNETARADGETGPADNETARAESETVPEVAAVDPESTGDTAETTQATDATDATRAAIGDVTEDVQPPKTAATGDVAELSPANVKVFDSQAEGDAPAPALWADISPASEIVSEDSGHADFLVTLSEPSERPVVIIFSTINLSANDQEDYQSQHGTVIFEPGVVSAEIRTPLIDDDVKESDEQFAMVLNGAPGIVQFKSRRVTTTIKDDD